MDESGWWQAQSISAKLGYWLVCELDPLDDVMAIHKTQDSRVKTEIKLNVVGPILQTL